MLKDRGTIKWTSLMLPEHVELLKQMWKENKKTPKPIIDSQMAELLELELIEAYEQQNAITLYHYGDGSIKKLIGKIASFDMDHKAVIFKTAHNETKTILFDHILSID